MIAPVHTDEEQALIEAVAHQLFKQLPGAQQEELRKLAGGPESVRAASMEFAEKYITAENGLGQKDLPDAVAYAKGLAGAGVPLNSIVPYVLELDKEIYEPLKAQIEAANKAQEGQPKKRAK